MVLTKLTSAGLDGLCSEEQLELLDAIDSLRSQGISHYISLPQLIVCGDQSSGKSSVLEAISGVSFPVNSSLCTRFPTELILRKSSHTSVRVSIVPHHSRSDDEKASLSGFHETLETFQELPNLIENAKAAMGIMTLGKAFSKDLLRIELSGPDRPHLTIVDLPGLIHSETKHQSASDIHLITDIVKSYMEEQRSVILAVVSAKNDYANQIVLKLARTADPKGTRTLGVITKPDTLVPGSGSENTYISLAKNMDVEFRLGWHVLMNRDTEAEAWTLADRDRHEANFFSKGSWSTLPASVLGIKSLRQRLSKLLLHQIASELPNLMDEISSKATTCQTQLEKLGRPRMNSQEQMVYLIQISQSFQALTQAASEGTYRDPFFGDPMSPSGYDKRIRAVVQNLGREFAKEMAEKGRHYRIVPDPAQESSDGTVILITRDDLINKIIKMMDQSRGRELPNTFSSMIVADLFKEQSMPWGNIAQRHIKKVWEAAKTFLIHLVTHVSDSTTTAAIIDTAVNPKLDALLVSLQKKTADLFQPHQSGHPITYDSGFTEAFHRIRHPIQPPDVKKILKKYFSNISMESNSYTNNQYVNFPEMIRELIDELGPKAEPDLSRRAAIEALDSVDAYYEIAMKRFIDDVSVQVIETALMAELGRILSPLAVAKMTKDEMADIAGEGSKSRTRRKYLEAKLKLLNSGTETCKRFSGFRVLDLNDDENMSDISSFIIEDESASIGDAKDAEADDAEFLALNSVNARVEDKHAADDVVEPAIESRLARLKLNKKKKSKRKASANAEPAFSAFLAAENRL